MKKDALQLLAAYGVRHKLFLMERELRELFRDFPEAFASETPPVLLRPERKPNGNDWPALASATSDETLTAPSSERRGSGEWTPERRAKQARHMKRMRSKLVAARHPKTKKESSKKTHGRPKGPRSSPWGTFVWQRVHDYLAAQPTRTASVGDIKKAAKVNSSASLITAVMGHKDLFQRAGEGLYKLKKVMEQPA